jgi:hypothetical protein
MINLSPERKRRRDILHNLDAVACAPGCDDEENSMDDKLDRMIDSLQQLAVNIEGLRGSVDGLVRVARDHEQRLRGLERWRNNLTPVIAAVTFILGSIFNVALRHFG